MWSGSVPARHSTDWPPATERAVRSSRALSTLGAMRELYPDAKTDIAAVDAYADLPVASGRPALRCNMIVSVDGGTSWGGVSGALGGPADKALFPVLRSFADLVLVAAGTMRAEG